MNTKLQEKYTYSGACWTQNYHAQGVWFFVLNEDTCILFDCRKLRDVRMWPRLRIQDLARHSSIIIMKL